MKKLGIIISLFLITIVLTACNSNSMEGTYVLSELVADGTTYTGSEWQKLTTEERKVVVKSGNKLEMIDVFTSDGKETTQTEYYTYDDTTVYGTDNAKTEEGIAYYTYEYNNGILKLTVLNDSHNTVWTYKKK